MFANGAGMESWLRVRPSGLASVRRRGTVLILVISLLTMLAIIGSTFVIMSRSSQQAAKHQTSAAQLDKALSAVIEQTKSVMSEDLWGTIRTDTSTGDIYPNLQLLLPPERGKPGSGNMLSTDMTTPHEDAVFDKPPLTNEPWDIPSRDPENYSLDGDTTFYEVDGDPWLADSSGKHISSYDGQRPFFSSQHDYPFRTGQFAPPPVGVNPEEYYAYWFPEYPNPDFTDYFLDEMVTDISEELPPNPYISNDPNDEPDGYAADADGDGEADSRWRGPMYVDANGVEYYVAARIIDNCSMVNVNTAWAPYGTQPANNPNQLMSQGRYLSQTWLYSPAMGYATGLELPGRSGNPSNLQNGIPELSYLRLIHDAYIMQIESPDWNALSAPNPVLAYYGYDPGYLLTASLSQFQPFDISDELELRNNTSRISFLEQYWNSILSGTRRQLLTAYSFSRDVRRYKLSPYPDIDNHNIANDIDGFGQGYIRKIDFRSGLDAVLIYVANFNNPDPAVAAKAGRFIRTLYAAFRLNEDNINSASQPDVITAARNTAQYLANVYDYFDEDDQPMVLDYDGLLYPTTIPSGYPQNLRRSIGLTQLLNTYLPAANWDIVYGNERHPVITQTYVKKSRSDTGPISDPITYNRYYAFEIFNYTMPDPDDINLDYQQLFVVDNPADSENDLDKYYLSVSGSPTYLQMTGAGYSTRGYYVFISGPDTEYSIDPSAVYTNITIPNPETAEGNSSARLYYWYSDSIPGVPRGGIYVPQDEMRFPLIEDDRLTADGTTYEASRSRPLTMDAPLYNTPTNDNWYEIFTNYNDVDFIMMDGDPEVGLIEEEVGDYPTGTPAQVAIGTFFGPFSPLNHTTDVCSYWIANSGNTPMVHDWETASTILYSGYNAATNKTLAEQFADETSPSITINEDAFRISFSEDLGKYFLNLFSMTNRVDDTLDNDKNGITNYNDHGADTNGDDVVDWDDYSTPGEPSIGYFDWTDSDTSGDITGREMLTVDTIDPAELRVPGMINVNTAPRQVLQALHPYINDSRAGTIEGARPVKSVADLAGEFSDPAPGVDEYLYNRIYTDVPGIDGDLQEQQMVWSRIANLATVRSDVFTGYFLIQGRKPLGDEDGDGVSDGWELVGQRRAIVIFDRSKCNEPPYVPVQDGGGDWVAYPNPNYRQVEVVGKLLVD